MQAWLVLPGRARGAWILVQLTALAGLPFILLADQQRPSLPEAVWLALFGALVARATRFRVPPVTHQLTGAIVQTALLVAGPEAALAATLGERLVRWTDRGANWPQWSFNLAIHTIGIGALWLFLRGIGDAAANPMMIVAACLARVVAQQLAIWSSHALATRRAPLAYALVGLRGQAWFLCQEVLLGLCLTVALGQAPVLVLAIVAVLFVEGQVGRRLMVAAESSVALRLQAEAEADRARRDGLTDLLNRRGLDEALACLEVVTGVLLIDIDHFKHINDGFGHQVGDRVLRAVAAAVQASVRPADQCARYGGEELCVLMPGIETSDILVAAAERVRLAIASIDLPEWPHLSVTASVGAGVLRPGCDHTSELALVDQALYRAKQRGRNQVQSSASGREDHLVARIA